MSSTNAQEFLGSNYANALKVFYGSAEEAFRNQVILFDTSPTTVPGGTEKTSTLPKLISQKNLTEGASGQFEMFSDLPDAEEHTPGDELLGQQFEVKPGTIAIDEKPVVAHVDVPETHLRLSHYDVLQRLGKKLGYSLARAYDKRLFRLSVLAARSAAVTQNGLNIHNGGNRVKSVAASVAAAYAVSSAGAIAYRQAIEQIAQYMDEDDVPEDGRYLMITPYIRRVLNQDSAIFDVRYTPDTPNSFNRRVIGELAGMKVMPVNGRIPTTNFTSGPTKYQGDFSVAGAYGEPAGLILCDGSDATAAIGSVVATGIVPEMQKDIRRGTVFMKASIHMGADIMHPWRAAVHDICTT